MPILSAFGAAKAIGVAGNPPVQNYAYDYNSTYMTYPTDSAFAIGSNDFSIECFVYLESTPTISATILDFGYLNSVDITYRNKLSFFINSSRQPTIARALSSGGQEYASTIAISLNTWTYVAASRVSSTVRVFVGSSLGRSATFSGTLVTSSNPPSIGKAVYVTRYFDGKISNLRFNVGSGFTSATVPTAPLNNEATTKMLTCQSATIKDNSVANAGGPWTITNNGATVTTGPF